MNYKRCSRCEKPFDYGKSNFNDTWELPICDDCSNKGLKPLGYHAYWNCKCNWCLKNKVKCGVCGCNFDKGSKCERDHKKMVICVGVKEGKILPNLPEEKK